MGDTLDYIDEECEAWGIEISQLIAEGYTLKQAEEIAGSAPLPDCYEYLMGGEI